VLTITEALAELKTIQKRLEKKRGMIAQYVARQDGIRDPLDKDGGSVEVIKRERQAIADLETRHVAIRTAIQKVNQTTPITIGETTKTIAEWLTWRKEIADGARGFIEKLRLSVVQARTQAQKQGFAVISATASANTTDSKPTDLVVNVDEAGLAREAEELEHVLGTLDGQLSLKNATVVIEV
jgi:hypothetical protein